MQTRGQYFTTHIYIYIYKYVSIYKTENKLEKAL